MNKISFKISRELYPKSVLFKTCFHFLDNYYLYLDVDQSNYIVELTQKENDDCDLNIKKLFFNELIAQNTRFIILEETKDIRKIILARAYSSTMVDTKETPAQVENDEINMFNDWFDNDGNKTE